LIHVLPWPKGKAKAPPGTLGTSAAGWEVDRASLVDLIVRFAAAPASQLAPTHPMFGRMTPRDWDVLMYRHLDHHLRQFSA
jgi:hypothetical protein